MRESMEDAKFRNLIKERGLLVPENLNDIDTFLISKQCILQGATSDEQLIGFATAYSDAKNLANNKGKLDALTAEELE